MKWCRRCCRALTKSEIKRLVNQHVAEPEQGSGQNGIDEQLADVADGGACTLPGAAEYQVHQDAGNHAGKSYKGTCEHERHGAVSHSGGQANRATAQEQDKREPVAHSQGLENRQEPDFVAALILVDKQETAEGAQQGKTRMEEIRGKPADGAGKLPAGLCLGFNLVSQQDEEENK